MIQGYTPDGFKFTASYDAQNRLISIGFTDGLGMIKRTDYSYAGDNLVSRIKEYTNNVLISDIQLLRSGVLTHQERDGNNTLIRNYLWNPQAPGGIGGLLGMSENGKNYTYHYDGRGNVTSLLEQNQNIAAFYGYDTFGVPTYNGGSFNQPYRFSTKRSDNNTGLVDFGYRFYNPTIGRWMSRDPLSYGAGDLNLYGFVQNNPINFIDPDGLSRIPISAIKNALTKVYEKLGGKLPKAKPGKFDSPQCGTPKKGYRLDPGHPDRPVGDPEAGPHINYWDYTNGKRGSGGISGAEPIIGGLLGFLGSMLDPFDAISGELASDGSDMLLPGGMPPRR